MGKIIEWIKNIISNKCTKCNNGRVRYIGDEFTGKVWISIYECERCKEKFI